MVFGSQKGRLIEIIWETLLFACAMENTNRNNFHETDVGKKYTSSNPFDWVYILNMLPTKLHEKRLMLANS